LAIGLAASAKPANWGLSAGFGTGLAAGFGTGLAAGLGAGFGTGLAATGLAAGLAAAAKSANWGLAAGATGLAAGFGAGFGAGFRHNVGLVGEPSRLSLVRTCSGIGGEGVGVRSITLSAGTHRSL